MKERNSTMPTYVDNPAVGDAYSVIYGERHSVTRPICPGVVGNEQRSPLLRGSRR